MKKSVAKQEIPGLATEDHGQLMAVLRVVLADEFTVDVKRHLQKRLCVGVPPLGLTSVG